MQTSLLIIEKQEFNALAFRKQVRLILQNHVLLAEDAVVRSQLLHVVRVGVCFAEVAHRHLRLLCCVHVLLHLDWLVVLCQKTEFVQLLLLKEEALDDRLVKPLNPHFFEKPEGVKLTLQVE